MRWLWGILLVMTACAPSSPFDADALIRWDTAPSAVVFRAELAGLYRDQPLNRANQVPLCTIYGDGHLIYTRQQASGGEDVFSAVVSMQALTDFIDAQLRSGLADFTARAPAVIPLNNPPIYQRLTLAFNDQTLISDEFSEWPVGFFDAALADCIALGADTAMPFTPQWAWVTARRGEQDSRAPVVLWDADAAGISLSQLADHQDRMWLSGDSVTALWSQIHQNPDNLQFVEGESRLQVAVQVPNVTLSAPSAP